MTHPVNKSSTLQAIAITLALTIGLPLVITPNMAEARRGGDDENRTEFHGIVESRPKSGLHGKWVIAGRTFTTDARTEFDQIEGKLKVGTCAKVHIRNGRVHEIDSEPMRNCR